MSEPRWYKENGNVYFADVTYEGSLVWVAEAAWHSEGYCDGLLVDLINLPLGIRELVK